MYTEFFGLEKSPFALTPDPEFLYLSRVHELACGNLEYCLLHHARIGLLTGEVGTGKTSLLRCLYGKLKTSRDTAVIPGSRLAPQDFLGMLAKAFALSPQSGGNGALVDVLFEYFLKSNSECKQCVIIIDDAENLPVKTFEELRVLSGLEVGSNNLVQVILAGRPQLRERLGHPSLAPLAQRITIHHHLSPLAPYEVGNYVRHRLNVAGYKRPEPLFTEAAIARVADFSRGVPRVINSLCDSLLTSTFQDGLAQVSEGIVEKTFKDNALLMGSPADDPKSARGGALAHPELSEPPLAESSPEGSAFEKEGTADTVDFAFAPLPSHYKTSFSQLTERLKALEKRLNVLELQCRESAIAVLQETFDEQRKQTSQHAKIIHSLSSSNSEIRSQLKELRTKLSRGESKPQAIDPEEMHGAADVKDPAKSPDAIWSLRSGHERGYLGTLTLLLITIGALGFLLYQGDWLSGIEFYRSGLRVMVSGIMQEREKSSDLSPETISPREAEERQEMRSGHLQGANPLDSGMRRPIIKPSAEFDSQEPGQNAEATSEVAAPTNGIAADDGRVIPAENLTELNPGMDRPVDEQVDQKGPKKDPPTKMLEERPAAETRSVLLFQLGRELRNGAAKTRQVPEMNADETRKDAESPRSAFSTPDPPQPASPARFSAEPATGNENLSPSQGRLHLLEIEAVQACWVQATIDKNKTERVVLEAGAKRAWEVAQEVEVVLGNPGGVQLKWDRKPINQVGKPGQPMRFRWPNTAVAGKP